MDISLTLYRTPPPKRLEHFAKLTNFELLPWADFISLQPNTNPSSGKIGMMFSLLKMKEPTPPSPKEPRPKKDPASTAVVTIAESTLKLRFSSISAIAFSDGPTAVGILHVAIKPWEKDSKSTVKGKTIHLAGAAKKDDVRVAGFKEMAPLIRSRYSEWPSESIAIFSFDSLTSDQIYPSESRANISLPGMLLAHSVYSGKKINPSIVFAGQFLSIDDAELPIIIPPANSADLIEKAKAIKTPFLAIPESGHKALLARVVALGSLDFIAKPQLLSFLDLDDAIKLSMEEPEEARAKAQAAFQEIVAVSSKMPLETLAANKKVQGRLEKIVKDYPRHLSAKIMLEFGRTNP